MSDWDDLKAEAEETAEERLQAGDECPEEHCSEAVHELHHPRDSRFGTDPHPDAPEREVVCIHDGIVG